MMQCRHGNSLGDRSLCPMCNMEQTIKRLEQNELRFSNRAFEAEKRVTELEAQLADMKQRNAFLRQRPDCPVDRIPVYKEMKAENQRLRDALRKWQNIEMDMMKMSRLNQWAAVRDAQEVTKKLLEKS